MQHIARARTATHNRRIHLSGCSNAFLSNALSLSYLVGEHQRARGQADEGSSLSLSLSKHRRLEITQTLPPRAMRYLFSLLGLARLEKLEFQIALSTHFLSFFIRNENKKKIRKTPAKVVSKCKWARSCCNKFLAFLASST